MNNNNNSIKSLFESPSDQKPTIQIWHDNNLVSIMIGRKISLSMTKDEYKKYVEANVIALQKLEEK